MIEKLVSKIRPNSSLSDMASFWVGVYSGGRKSGINTIFYLSLHIITDTFEVGKKKFVAWYINVDV
jgi:hypothetical protein